MKVVVLNNREDELAFKEFLFRKNFSKNNSKLSIPEIKMFLTDCDGCLTDGGMYYSEKGDELKKFNTRDGMGFAILRGRGIITGIVTSETVELNHRRAEKLKLDILKDGCNDKLGTIKGLCIKLGIDIGNVCYIGDDINDIEAIKAVGFGCCPADAISKVIAVADYIAERKGGEGVIREIVDLIIEKTDNKMKLNLTE